MAGTRPHPLYRGGNLAQSFQGRRSLQNLIEESRIAGNSLPRPPAQRGGYPAKYGYGSASESRTGASGAQSNQHDYGHLQPRSAYDAAGRSQ